MSTSRRAKALARCTPLALLLDGERPDGNGVRTLLTENGYDVIHIETGADAIGLCAEHMPDLVLINGASLDEETDLSLLTASITSEPGMADVPVVLLVKSVEPERVRGWFEAGVTDYLLYPPVAEELLQRLQTHAELLFVRQSQQQVNRSEGRATALIAHDLKNPMASIRFSADMLRECAERYADDKHLVELIDAVSMTSEHALGFIERFLEDRAAALAVAPATRQPFRVVRVVRRCVRSAARNALRKDIEIRFRPSSDFTVLGEPQATRRILDNLLDNAVKFSPHGSSVTVRIDAGADRLCVRVEDEGPGITPRDREKLFQRFERLGNRPTADEPSTGLGLALCHELAGQVGARLWYEDGSDGGSVFVLALPLYNGG